MESKQVLRDTANKEASYNTYKTIHTSAYIQCFCLYLNQQTSCFQMSGHFVCVHDVHTPTQQSILSYSLSHSVELPLVFTGVVFYITYVKQQLLHRTI